MFDTAESAVEAAWKRGLAPDPILTVDDWANRHRMLSSVASAEPGRWSTSRTPYLKAVMEALSATSRVERVVLMAGAQIGKTEAGLNWLGYVIHHAPGPMLLVQPTVEGAKRVSKQRVDALIEASPELASRVKDPRSRDSGNTQLMKEFPGGVLIMTGANSAVGLRSMPVRYLFLDEVDGYPGDADGEGDPVALAVQRAATFVNRKVYLCSTPTLKGFSRIEAAYLESDQRVFEVPCDHCGAHSQILWRDIKWPKDKMADAAWHCPHCDGTSASLLSMAWTRIQTGALGLIAPIKSAALAFWSMLPAIGATTAALLANPITWIVVGIGAAVAGLALVIRKYWDPIAAYVGGVFQGVRSALQPAISSLSSALAPLAPIGQAVASVFGFMGDAISGLVGWVGDLLSPVTLTTDEFNSLSDSGQSLGAVIGGVLSTAFAVLTFPIRAVGTLVGWVMEGFRALASFSPFASLQAAWQPLSGFFGGLWAGVVTGAQSAWQQLTAALGSFAPLQALQSVIGSMLTALRDLPGQFMSLGSAMLQGLAQGVRNAAQQAVAAVGEVAAGVRDRFKAMLGINSPSRVFATLGSALSLGLAQGVAAAGPAVVNEVGQLAQSLQSVPFALGTPEVTQPGLRLPSPDRPSLGLALPAPQIDVPVPTLRPVREGTLPPEAQQAKGVRGDVGVPERAQSVPVPMLPPTPGVPPSAVPPAPGAPSIHFAPQITIHAAPGSDPQALADLLEGRLRSLIREALRGSSAALHD